MATRRMLAACVILASCAAGGCGTFLNLNDFHGGVAGQPYEVYGGVHNDLQFAELGLSLPLEEVKSIRLETAAGLIPACFTSAVVVSAAVVDMPLSLLGDTLTLPWVLMENASHSSFSGEPVPSPTVEPREKQKDKTEVEMPRA